MAIIRNGKVYRNIQEQVLKNTEDIDELNHRLPIEGKFYTEDETDALLAKKQNTLVSSGDNQNIKTINGQDILGTGNIETTNIHIYVINFSYDTSIKRYIGEFIFSSSVNANSSIYTDSTLYSTFGQIRLNGIGIALNKSNVADSNGFYFSLDSNGATAYFNYYDEDEGDWQDEYAYPSSFSVRKLI